MASSFQNANVIQQKQSQFLGSTIHFKPMIAKRQSSRRGNQKSSTTLGMSFLGDGGGIFGIGAPEIVSKRMFLNMNRSMYPQFLFSSLSNMGKKKHKKKLQQIY